MQAEQILRLCSDLVPGHGLQSEYNLLLMPEHYFGYRARARALAPEIVLGRTDTNLNRFSQYTMYVLSHSLLKHQLQICLDFLIVMNIFCSGHWRLWRVLTTCILVSEHRAVAGHHGYQAPYQANCSLSITKEGKQTPFLLFVLFFVLFFKRKALLLL